MFWLKVWLQIVPGYYLRRNTDGFIENSTCVNNTASEHFMVERLILDDLLHWAVDYKVILLFKLVFQIQCSLLKSHLKWKLYQLALFFSSHCGKRSKVQLPCHPLDQNSECLFPSPLFRRMEIFLISIVYRFSVGYEFWCFLYINENMFFFVWTGMFPLLTMLRLFC